MYAHSAAVFFSLNAEHGVLVNPVAAAAILRHGEFRYRDIGSLRGRGHVHGNW